MSKHNNTDVMSQELQHFLMAEMDRSYAREMRRSKAVTQAFDAFLSRKKRNPAPSETQEWTLDPLTTYEALRPHPLLVGLRGLTQKPA
jgi:hypothetical protein